MQPNTNCVNEKYGDDLISAAVTIKTKKELQNKFDKNNPERKYLKQFTTNKFQEPINQRN